MNRGPSSPCPFLRPGPPRIWRTPGLPPRPASAESQLPAEPRSQAPKNSLRPTSSPARIRRRRRFSTSARPKTGRIRSDYCSSTAQ